MRKVETKDYRPILSILFVLIAISLSFLLINNYVLDLRDAKIDAYALDKENEQLERNLEALSELKGQLAQNPEIKQYLDLALPEDDMIAEIIKTIEVVANNNAVGVTGISKGSGSKTGSQNVNIVLNFENTTYESLKLFLENLDGNIRIVEVNGLSLSRYDTDTNSGLVSGNIQLSFFSVGSSNN